MKTKILSLVAAFLLIAATGLAKELKLGIVNMEYVIKSSQKVSKSKDKLRDEFNKLQADLSEKEKALLKKKEDFEAQKLLYSDEVKKEKEKEITLQEESLVNTLKEYQINIKKNEQRLLDNVVKTIKKIAKAEGYDLVIEKKSGYVIYVTPALNITESILELYDETSEE